MLTIKDIAQKANVSIATVSRYLNNPEVVSDVLSQQIAAVIKDNNYTPNKMAKALITKHNNTIGLIVPDINNIFYPPILLGIENVVEKEDYISFLCNTDQNIKREKNYIETLLSQRVAGMIIIGTRHTDSSQSEHLLELQKKVPLLMLFETMYDGIIPSISNDEAIGSYKAVKYLLKLGHKKIAFLTSEKPLTTYKHKLEGYLKALHEAKLPINPDYIIHDVEYELGGYQAMRRLLKMNNCPTAVHTANDQMAVGAIKSISEHGYKVPRDFSVIGYANASISGQTYPALTTVNQFAYDIGALAGQKILNLIKGESPDDKAILIEPQLIIRQSCSPLLQ